MRLFISETIDVIKKSWTKYWEDGPIKLAATLSFVMVFAIPVILTMILSLLGLFLNEEDLLYMFHNGLDDHVDRQVANLIQQVILNYKASTGTPGSMGLIIFIFVLASTTLFAVLQNSLNYIWRIKPKPRYTFIKAMKDRSLSFLIILGLGIIFFGSLILDAYIFLVKDYFDAVLPNYTFMALRVSKFIIIFLAVTLTFAVLFKFLPDADIVWGVTWFGAIVTSLLFSFGKFLITFGLTHIAIGPIYGPAGPIVILLLWVFYSAMIFFFGVQVTAQYAASTARPIMPKKHAVVFEIIELNHVKKDEEDELP